MEFQSNLCTCAPAQIINFEYAFNFEDLDKLIIYNKEECKYNDLQYSYSVDNVCWSCYMSYDELLSNAVGLQQDFYLRLKVSGVIGSILFKDEIINWYTTSLATGFNFVSGCSSQMVQNNVYNPYANMDCAIGLYQQLTEVISCTIGLPIYYFKLSPNAGSKDITFKEYTLMDVAAVKQIKLIVQDGQMPSSKPEFNDWGLDWQSDWEVEISKATFATAFGNNAQPMEGDIIWIPMMKRMWMVNESYEEKKDSFMWNATTFKVTLVKYQEKESVNLGETESLVNSFVKNKYDDLFGEDENIGSQSDAVDSPTYAASNLYPVYESDATRKYITCNTIDFVEESTYYKATVISDLCYTFNVVFETAIIYQHQYCGSSGTISFIVKPMIGKTYDGPIIECGNNIKVNIIQQANKQPVLYIPLLTKLAIPLINNETYLVVLKWSNEMNVCDLSVYNYSHPSNIPLYKLQPFHYYYDIDNGITKTEKFNIELLQETKHDVILHGLNGTVTNIKIFDIYNDNVSEIMQMYPSSNHLLINDTARKLLDLNGVILR